MEGVLLSAVLRGVARGARFGVADMINWPPGQLNSASMGEARRIRSNPLVQPGDQSTRDDLRWISAAPSKMDRMQASHSTRLTGYSIA
jgi:hypothetical protein